jgi:hypothetical protein
MIEKDTFHLETTVSSNGTVIITGLPLQSGDVVDVTVRKREGLPAGAEVYSLRGMPFVECL